MNTYWKIIPFLWILPFLLKGECCLAAEPLVEIFAEAAWESEEDGIAKVTLKEIDQETTEESLGKTDYLFMVDGSRTTTLNDYYLRQENTREQEPLGVHCPCMADGHYYQIGSRQVLPVTHTMGYLKGTKTLITWSAERKIWADSAGAHFNEKGKVIPVRYSNGCKDIFTLYKDLTIATIQRIAERKDGSRVAFLSYSASDGTLYGMTEFTDDYEEAIHQIRESGFLPGSSLGPALTQALKLCSEDSGAEVKKILIMGDGKQSDIQQGIEMAAQLRNIPGVLIYTACMGAEVYSQGSGYKALAQMTGGREERFFPMLRTVNENLSQAFSVLYGEKVSRKIKPVEKVYSWNLPKDLWTVVYDPQKEYECSATKGTLTQKGNQMNWILTEESGERICEFYIQISEDARCVDQTTYYDPVENLRCTYQIQGGERDGQKEEVATGINQLVVVPGELQFQRVWMVSGWVNQKEEQTYYVKADTEVKLGFTTEIPHSTNLWKPEENALIETTETGQEHILPEIYRLITKEGAVLTSKFRCRLSADGERRTYNPVAMAGREGHRRWFYNTEEGKKMTLICDGKAPEIQGVIPERILEKTKILLAAKDTGSGILDGSFILELENPKTQETKTIYGTGAELSFEVDPEDGFYQGILRWNLQVQDRVGNKTQLSGEILIEMPKDLEETVKHEIHTRIL